ncbi:uncharacterized protein GGS22DRAFT_185504 [Annulohypoxylon maeteangense]|uniref:uncharacterized protein n=1 Tax=Annulohypoxylon maeteangense TaxID=1927788 RepID=UPI0020074627|nr:uncharacterized protein GGS22DRAFT_185504 [Annulohypoxylon maeteangense]KAI0888124.1 hypothetical protein GGS22DRAFT_185504 [Annulohypoxylon maeteangense]
MDTAQDISQLPALEPPAGVVPNFIDPFTFYPWILAIGLISIVLMTAAVGIRIYTKAVILKSMKHEDYFAIFALIGFLIWDIIFIYLSGLGLSRNQWDIRAIDVSYFLYMMNVIEIIYGPSMLAAKYFVLVQLRRIFCPGSLRNSVWWIINGLIAATVGYYIACFFTFTFQCWPRAAIWNPVLEPDATCINFKVATLVSGVINMLLDIGIFLTPLWAIWLIQMPMKRKLGVISVFGVGFFTCAIAVLGVVFRVPLVTDDNLTMAIAKVGLFTFAEYFGTIFVGCMPLFPRFWARMRGKEPLESQGTKSSFSNSHIKEGSMAYPATRIRSSAQSPSEAHLRHDSYIELEDGRHDSQEWRSVGYAV